MGVGQCRNPYRRGSERFEMKIMSWNIRGLNNRSKRRVVKEIINKTSRDILLLQETKITKASWSFMRSICCCSFRNWVLMETKGRFGGILVI